MRTKVNNVINIFQVQPFSRCSSTGKGIQPLAIKVWSYLTKLKKAVTEQRLEIPKIKKPLLLVQKRGCDYKTLVLKALVLVVAVWRS
jgi:hypothetical protein